MNCQLILDGFHVGNTVVSEPAFLKLEFSTVTTNFIAHRITGFLDFFYRPVF
jgi:hypothetical protein